MCTGHFPPLFSSISSGVWDLFYNFISNYCFIWPGLLLSMHEEYENYSNFFKLNFSKMQKKKCIFFRFLLGKGKNSFNRHECLEQGPRDKEGTVWMGAALHSLGSMVGNRPSSSLRQPSGLVVYCACWRHPYLSAASLLPPVSAFPTRPFKITFVTLPSNHT